MLWSLIVTQRYFGHKQYNRRLCGILIPTVIICFGSNVFALAGTVAKVDNPPFLSDIPTGGNTPGREKRLVQ